jgi:hypothetical protein
VIAVGRNVFTLLRSTLFDKGYAGRVLVSIPDAKYWAYLYGISAQAQSDAVGKQLLSDGRVMFTVDMQVRARSARGGALLEWGGVGRGGA